MRSTEKLFAAINSKTRPKMAFMAGLLSFLTFLLFILSTNVSFAHCDTMDGPVIKDARMAIEKNNVNYVLKWVQPQNEQEVKDIFKLTVEVRNLNPDARILADRYFFETIVRLHRTGEGVPFNGIKPSGIPVDPKIMAADKSIESGNLSALRALVPEKKWPELTERFKKVMALRDHDVNNTEAGREYVEAYVKFFKFAEGEDDHDVAKTVYSSVHNH